MNTLDALQKRKSVRGYLDQPVEESKLKTILKYGNKAPNAGPFQMSVIRNKALLDELNQTVADFVKTCDNDFLKQRFSIPGYQATYGAPVLIIVSAPAEGYGTVNAACAVTNMTVAAIELGLGSCYLVSVCLAFQANPELAKRVGIPDGFIPQCGLIIGYEAPKQIPGKEWVESDSNINYID